MSLNDGFFSSFQPNTGRSTQCTTPSIRTIGLVRAQSKFGTGHNLEPRTPAVSILVCRKLTQEQLRYEESEDSVGTSYCLEVHELDVVRSKDHVRPLGYEHPNNRWKVK
jgi:hypothetical protein